MVHPFIKKFHPLRSQRNSDENSNEGPVATRASPRRLPRREPTVDGPKCGSARAAGPCRPCAPAVLPAKQTRATRRPRCASPGETPPGTRTGSGVPSRSGRGPVRGTCARLGSGGRRRGGTGGKARDPLPHPSPRGPGPEIPAGLGHDGILQG